MNHPPTPLGRFTRRIGLIAASAVCAVSAISTASAASSWSPTLLVNTEAFQQIDVGDGTSNIELRFGASTKTIKFLYTKQVFQFSHGISVLGTVSGSSLNVDRNATVGGTLTVTGAITGLSTITAKTVLSGATLRVSAGGADIHGPLAVSGAIRTDGNLTINDDGTAADVVLTFGHSVSQTITYLNTKLVFQFSKGISVLGTISGSSLNVDRNATVGGTLTVTGATAIRGNLSASGTVFLEGHLTGATIAGFGLTSCSAAGQTLQWDSGTNKFVCATSTVGNGSGGIISLHAEFPNAIYFASGATTSAIGQLSASGNIVNGQQENYYHWQTTQSSEQSYWVSVRLRLPDNFSSWDLSKAIQMRFRTGSNTSSENHITVRMRDTNNNLVTLANNEGKTTVGGQAFSTIDITGPESSGTWAAKGYYTLYVKLSANGSTKFADLSMITLRYETTTP